MTFENILDLFDDHYVAETQAALDQEYTANSNNIFCDGSFEHHVKSDGYIKIYNISHDANYVIFLDKDGDLFISIYKYIDEPKYKHIIDHLNELRKTTGVHRHSAHSMHLAEIEHDNNIFDINTLDCLECGNELRFTRIKDSDTIVGYCHKCNIEYALIPSKFYVLKAVKHLYSDNINARDFRKILKEDKE